MEGNGTRATKFATKGLDLEGYEHPVGTKSQAHVTGSYIAKQVHCKTKQCELRVVGRKFKLRARWEETGVVIGAGRRVGSSAMADCGSCGETWPSLQIRDRPPYHIRYFSLAPP